MTKFFTTLALAATALSAVVTPIVANAAYDRNFTVVNTNNNSAIQRVWFARAGETGSWIAANMNGSPVWAGSSSVFSLTAGTACYYDVKIQFADGYEQTFGSVNVCNGDRAVAS